MSARAIGVDVGGTSVKALLVDADGGILAERRAPTPVDPTGAALVETVAALVDALDVPGDLPVGVVVPGIVDDDRGVVVHAVNLGWRDLPLAALLGARLGRRVALGHDVRAGALAEARTGAARGVPGVVGFVAIGTGVAAALLVEGRPVVAGGWAGEIGQLVLTEGPHTGRRLEEVASAAALARRAGAPDARAVAERVAAGDPEATAVWQDGVDVLAGALAALVITAAPSAIVIGGGLALAGDLLLDPLRAGLERRVTGLRVPDLRAAAHGDRAAALGAALLAQEAGSWLGSS